LKPETTFKNLRQFLTYLPIDYYILLQGGFEEKKSFFAETKYVMFSNLPLLKKRQMKTSGKQVINPLVFDDVYRAQDPDEALSMLEDEFAINELITHLEVLYGEVEELSLLNYAPEKIVRFLTREQR
jgi:hypothetical protein